MLCKYNFSSGFERNYFVSISCFCKEKQRMEKCLHYKRLEHSFNFKILKICIRTEDFPYCNFNYIRLNNYLENLDGDRFFYFNKSLNMIEYLIENKETM